MIYGTIRFAKGEWVIRAEPFVLARLKKVIPAIGKRAIEKATLSHTPENCHELAWFVERFPMAIENEDTLRAAAKEYTDRIQRIGDLLGGHVPPEKYALAFPPRDYQAVAISLYRASRGTVIGDEVGLGKTVVGIGSLTDPELLPALIVAPAHLCRQWDREVTRFAPALRVERLKSTKPYKLPTFMGLGPDVLIASYHKLAGWATTLREYCRSIVFDEVQELRGRSTERYEAAKVLRARMRACLGLSATPIFGYGGEAFNVWDIIKPGCLGTYADFATTWCKGTNAGPDDAITEENAPPIDAPRGKVLLRDPRAFGSWLRNEGLFLRRTRRDVGRELPAIQKIPIAIDYDLDVIDKAEDAAAELARIILRHATTHEEGTASFSAAGQIDMKMRQATGIAKAGYVAKFVLSLVEAGEPVLLGGWHRSVYDLWMAAFDKAGVPAVLYSGTESAAAKDKAQRDFELGRAKVMVISNRSGAGLEGLYRTSSVVVHGELDWSPAIHDQLNGRLNRDGQTKPVLAYYPIAERGTDPIVAGILGLKRAQLEGIQNPDASPLEPLNTDGARSRKIAEAILARKAEREGRKVLA